MQSDIPGWRHSPLDGIPGGHEDERQSKEAPTEGTSGIRLDALR